MKLFIYRRFGRIVTYKQTNTSIHKMQYHTERKTLSKVITIIAIQCGTMIGKFENRESMSNNYYECQVMSFSIASREQSTHTGTSPKDIAVGIRSMIMAYTYTMSML